MRRRPVSGDIDAGRDPNARLVLHIVQEPLEAGRPRRLRDLGVRILGVLDQERQRLRLAQVAQRSDRQEAGLLLALGGGLLEQSLRRARTIDPLQYLLADERRKMVRLALSKLNPRDAEMLLLKYTENWNYQIIGEHLGMTRSAVESRLHRARQKMRTELAKLNVVEPPKK